MGAHAAAFKGWSPRGWASRGLVRLAVCGLALGTVSGLAGCGDFDAETASAGAETPLDRSQDLKRIAFGDQAPPGSIGGRERDPAFADRAQADADRSGDWRKERRPAAYAANSLPAPANHADPAGADHLPARGDLPADFADHPRDGQRRFNPEARGNAQASEDCLVCGRETGFLGSPVLVGEVGADKSVELTWDAVDGAEYYLVTALASGYEDNQLPPAEFQWRTNLTGLSLHLPEHQLYRFTVQARRERPKARSVASNEVSIEL